MTFDQWWQSDENRWSDTRYVKKVAEMAWNASRESLYKAIAEEFQRQAEQKQPAE